MKKIFMALTFAAFGWFSAEAQTETKTIACGAPEGKVCHRNGCYKTKFAENYAVCKGEYGYYICCEEPNANNATFPPILLAGLRPYKDANAYEEPVYQGNEKPEPGMDPDVIAPQSQSYPRYVHNATVPYDGYTAKKTRIHVCSNTDNVAENNRQAYAGCPTPAYDGPDRNMDRNRNVSNPNSSYPAPPVTGKRY